MAIKNECPECKWSVVDEEHYFYSYCGNPGDTEDCPKFRKLRGLPDLEEIKESEDKENNPTQEEKKENGHQQ